MVTKNIKLKQLNLNPLSVAKYFWEKGVEDMALSQRLIYLSYLEIMKDGYLLFEEKWQAWPHGPAVESAFNKMFDNRHNLKKLFAPVEKITEKKALNQLENVYRKYKDVEPYIIFEKAQNKPWKDARKPLKSEKEISPIELTSLVNFTNGNGKRARAI